jgi:hypothetical protein
VDGEFGGAFKMIDVTVTAELADQIRSASELVVLRGPAGDVVGVIDVPNRAIVKNEDELLAEIKERRNRAHRWYSTAEVFSHLLQLEKSN